ncbi:hypothetical protein QYE76_054033 [Lolium multiflorum]|uniref:Uncharacterized protein n=1 Tax=Lolium multiflorum TaxID=4521 RepID=A0AAD8WKM5_LOLMU|nr:hypothetical protein QYE76_054033 [Lolium multiflorum]
MYHSFSLLKEECSNNEAEYEALIFGLLLALSMDVRSLRAYGDSQLIVRQVNGIYEVRKPELVPYYNAARNLMGKFLHVEVLHVPRSRNAPADALAKLAAALVLPDDKSMQVTVEKRWLLPAVLELIPPEYEVNTITTNMVDQDEWLQPFLDYFKHGSLPDDPIKRRQLQRRLPSYVYKAGVLYKRSHGQEILLRCVNRGEAEKILQEMHHGVCGGHQGGAKMYHSIRLAGYYWPGIMTDCLRVAKSCHGCQIHGDFKHQPPVPLHPTVPSWPFDAWGIDFIGPIDPPSSRGHRFILVATDYFSKWAEAVPLREVKSDNIINFLERNIIYRFGIPHRITSDNAKAFKSKKMYRLMAKYKIKWNYSTGYYPQANGAIEAFNKTLDKILKKTVKRHRRDWHDRLFESLWAYHVTVRTPTQPTPYSLVYGSEAVLPLEVQLPSLRVAIQDELTKDEQVHLRFQELNALEEERLYALQNLELYRQNMVRAYDKLVKHRVFRKGELVLVLRRPIVVTHKTKGKFEPKWEGPYAIEQVYDRGAYQLVDSQGSRPMPPMNGRWRPMKVPEDKMGHWDGAAKDYLKYKTRKEMKKERLEIDLCLQDSINPKSLSEDIVEEHPRQLAPSVGNLQAPDQSSVDLIMSSTSSSAPPPPALGSPIRFGSYEFTPHSDSSRSNFSDLQGNMEMTIDSVHYNVNAEGILQLLESPTSESMSPSASTSLDLLAGLTESMDSPAPSTPRSASSMSVGSDEPMSSELTSYYCSNCDARHGLGSSDTPFICNARYSSGEDSVGSIVPRTTRRTAHHQVYVANNTGNTRHGGDGDRTPRSSRRVSFENSASNRDSDYTIADEEWAAARTAVLNNTPLPAGTSRATESLTRKRFPKRSWSRKTSVKTVQALEDDAREITSNLTKSFMTTDTAGMPRPKNVAGATANLAAYLINQRPEGSMAQAHHGALESLAILGNNLVPQKEKTTAQASGSKNRARDARDEITQSRIDKARRRRAARKDDDSDSSDEDQEYDGELRGADCLSYKIRETMPPKKFKPTPTDAANNACLQLYLKDSARAWLRGLPKGSIKSWDDLVDAFVANFQATYKRHVGIEELRSCQQKQKESMRSYIGRFTKLLNAAEDVSVDRAIDAFSDGVRRKSYIEELGRKKPKTITKLMEIANSWADGEDNVQRPRQRSDVEDDDQPKHDSGSRRDRNKRRKNRNYDDNNLVAAGYSNRHDDRYDERRDDRQDGNRNNSGNRGNYKPRQQRAPELPYAEQINAPCYLHSSDNFRKEKIEFEVVNWESQYHAILGRPAYAKFMAVPHYAYLKLKMPGNKGTNITVHGSFSRSDSCDRDFQRIAAKFGSKQEFIKPPPKLLLREIKEEKDDMGSKRKPADLALKASTAEASAAGALATKASAVKGSAVDDAEDIENSKTLAVTAQTPGEINNAAATPNMVKKPEEEKNPFLA